METYQEELTWAPAKTGPNPTEARQILATAHHIKRTWKHSVGGNHIATL